MSSGEQPKHVFFTDADISDRLFHQILADAGISFERHGAHFPEGADDPDWLQKAGDEGWIVLSHDKKIRTRSGETERLMEAGVRAFMLMGKPYQNPPGQKSAFTQELARNVVSMMPAIERFLRRYDDGPWIAKLYRPPPERPYEPGRIQMWLTFAAFLRTRP